MEAKKFYLSKTLLFNLLAALILWIVPAIFPDFVLAVPAEWAPFEIPVVLVVNMILRLVTKQPLGV